MQQHSVMQKEYNCQIYYPLKGLAYFIPIIILYFVLFGFIAVKLDAPIIGVVAFIFFAFTPYFLPKKFQVWFSKKALFKFGEIFFSITITDLHNEGERK